MKRLLSIIFCVLLFLASCSMDAPSVVHNYTLSITWKGEYSYPPSNPQVGWAYYNTSQKASFVWDGDSWEVMSKDGKSIEWKGELEKAPNNPKENWAYFNKIDGNSYIYTGSEWCYLAKSGRDGSSGIMLWLGTLSTAPNNPSVGTCYYDSSKKASYIWDGDSWEILSKDGANGESGKDGISILWKGALSAFPINPQKNWAYFNTSDKKSYIYDGNTWQIFSETIGGDTNVLVSIEWLGTFETAPTNPKIGQGYYNSTTKASYIFDGTVWQQISKDGIDGQPGKDGISPEIEGYLINWKGEASTTLENPKAGWAYYNTSDKKSYIFDGVTWQILAQDGKENGTEGNPYNKTNLFVSIYINGEWSYQNNTERISVVNFGTVGINSSQGITSCNIGTEGKNNIELTGQPAIQLTGRDKDSFVVVQPKKTNAKRGDYIKDARIYFIPTSIGEKSATVTIKNNSDDCPNFSFTVKGNCEYWPKSFDGGEGNGKDSIKCAAEDSQGNLYFAGYGFELVNDHSGNDCWIKKFDKNGIEDTINWNKKLSFIDDYEDYYRKDFIRRILIDNKDNVIVCTDNRIISYTSLGQIKWEKKFNESSYPDVYCDKNNNVYVGLNDCTKKYTEDGVELFSIPDTGDICIDSNNNFIIYGLNYIKYYNSNGTEKFKFDEPINYENGWINSTCEEYKPKYWQFNVKKGKKYAIQANSKGSSYGDNTKTGNFRYDLKYKSTNTSLCDNDSADYIFEKPYEFTSREDGFMVMATYSTGTDYNGSIGFRIFEDYIDSHSKTVNVNRIDSPSFELKTVKFDKDNNFYLIGYDSLSNNFERKNARISKYDNTGKKVQNWNKSFDWNHCEDETANRIEFLDNGILVIGSGQDILNGASENDTWIKCFDLLGNETTSYVLDIPYNHILTVNSYGQLYIYEGELYTTRNYKIIGMDGSFIKNLAESDFNYHYFLFTDKYLYLYGNKVNQFSAKSNEDWYIERISK